MGAGLSKEILPGLYVGDMKTAQNKKLLEQTGVTHILAVCEVGKAVYPDFKYLLIPAADNPDFDIKQYFHECLIFIHTARKSGGTVLVHCFAGSSRSVTIAVAYLSVATSLTTKEGLTAIRACHPTANPNSGFKSQLAKFTDDGSLDALRKEINKLWSGAKEEDEKFIRARLEAQEEFIASGVRPKLFTDSTRDSEKSSRSNSITSRISSSEDNDKMCLSPHTPNNRLPSTPISSNFLHKPHFSRLPATPVGEFRSPLASFSEKIEHTLYEESENVVKAIEEKLNVSLEKDEEDLFLFEVDDSGSCEKDVSK